MTKTKPPEAPIVRKVFELLRESEVGKLLSKNIENLIDAFVKANKISQDKKEIMDIVPIRPADTTKEPLSMAVEMKDGNVKIGADFYVRAVLLQEISFKRKGKSHIKVIADVYEEGSASVTPYLRISSKVIGVIKNEELPELEKQLDDAKISKFYLSPMPH